MASSSTTGPSNAQRTSAAAARRPSARAVSLAQAADLACRLARIDDEAALARTLAAAARRLARIERAWVLYLHESTGELTEAVRVPDSAGGARMTVGVEALARLDLPAAVAGVLLRAGHPLAESLVAGERVGTLGFFVPHGRSEEPTLALVVSPEPGVRLRAADRAALQISADVAGHALDRRRLLARIELYKTDAERDFLTGIFNRRLTMRLLEREIRKSQRTRSPLSLVMIDVDNFRSFNDAHGHLAGDEVLRALARLFVTAGRATDVVGRFGGEEFLIVLPDTPIEHAVIFSERLRQDVERFGREHLRHLRDDPPTISIGVCAVGPSDTTDAAISRADRALYESKRRGRNCFSLELPEENPA